MSPSSRTTRGTTPGPSLARRRWTEPLAARRKPEALPSAVVCALNGQDLVASTHDAVAEVLAIAARQAGEAAMAAWIAERITDR